MIVCLTIATIALATCVPDAVPVGDCVQRMPERVDCIVQDATTIPIRASYYDPSLGGTNCQEPCDYTGDLTHVDDCYGVCLACPVGWYGNWIQFDEWIGRWQCRDHGGAIEPGYGRYFTQNGWFTGWVITVDFMTNEEPAFAYWLLDWQFNN